MSERCYHGATFRSPVRKREGGEVALHLPTEPLKFSFWCGAGTDMRTQHLPANSPKIASRSHISRLFLLHLRYLSFLVFKKKKMLLPEFDLC